jgi:hypothetical protein
MSDHNLDDWGSIPAEEKHVSSSLYVQNTFEANQTSNPMGTDHTPPSSADVKNEYEQYFLSHQRAHGGSRRVLLVYFISFIPIN